MEKALVIFSDIDISIQSVYQALKNENLTVHWDSSKTLLIPCKDCEANIFVNINRGLEAQDEICQISDGSVYEFYLNECNTFFEISFDDFDEVLDEINTLIDVESCLQKLTQGFLYYSWNKSITAVDDQ